MVKTEVEIVVNTTDATKSIDEVGSAVDKAAGNFENLSAGAEGARQVLDEATGGLASRVKNVATGLMSMGKSATKAFKAAMAGASGMKKALLTTGIGAVLVALGAVVAYWDEIVTFLGFADDETKKVTEAQKEYNTALAGAKGTDDDIVDVVGILETANGNVTGIDIEFRRRSVHIGDKTILEVGV